jgi:hypothetical protein
MGQYFGPIRVRRESPAAHPSPKCRDERHSLAGSLLGTDRAGPSKKLRAGSLATISSNNRPFLSGARSLDGEWRRNLKNRLLLVVLDNLRRTHLRLVGISAKFTKCPALPQQVPALVKMNLQVGQAAAVIFREVVLPIQGFLFLHQPIDVAQHRLIVVIFNVNSFSLSCLPLGRAIFCDSALLIAQLLSHRRCTSLESFDRLF